MFVANEPDAQAQFSPDPHFSSLCSQKPVTYISFCCPALVGFSQDWATFYTFFTLHLPEEERKTKWSLCLFRGLASRRGAVSQFYYEISWGKAQHVWRQQVLAVEVKLAALLGHSEEKEQKHGVKRASAAEYFSLSPYPLELVGNFCHLCCCRCFYFYFRINLDIKLVRKQ